MQFELAAAALTATEQLGLDMPVDAEAVPALAVEASPAFEAAPEEVLAVAASAYGTDVPCEASGSAIAVAVAVVPVVIDTATFIENVTTFFGAVEGAKDELIEGGYKEYADQIGAWLSGLKTSYGADFNEWPSALDVDSRKPKAPPAICALRPHLHDSARKLKEALLERWSASAADSKPSVQAARKRTAKALVDAAAAKLKPQEKPTRKRAKSGGGAKAITDAAVAAVEPAATFAAITDASAGVGVPPLVAVAATGDIPVAVATVAADTLPSTDTTDLITAMATVAGGEAGGAAASAAAAFAAAAAIVECNVEAAAPEASSEAAMTDAAMADAVADADVPVAPIDAVASAGADHIYIYIYIYICVCVCV